PESVRTDGESLSRARQRPPRRLFGVGEQGRGAVAEEKSAEGRGGGVAAGAGLRGIRPGPAPYPGGGQVPREPGTAPRDARPRVEVPGRERERRDPPRLLLRLSPVREEVRRAANRPALLLRPGAQLDRVLRPRPAVLRPV